jgi:hypothetical protein
MTCLRLRRRRAGAAPQCFLDPLRVRLLRLLEEVLRPLPTPLQVRDGFAQLNDQVVLAVLANLLHQLE